MDEPPYDISFYDEPASRAEDLWGIGRVLMILRETANAYINAEALEQLQQEIRQAAELEQEPWAKELLKSDDLLNAKFATEC